MKFTEWSGPLHCRCFFGEKSEKGRGLGRGWHRVQPEQGPADDGKRILNAVDVLEPEGNGWRFGGG